MTGGRLFLEGPTWDAGNHRLLFSDVPGNTIFAWDGSVVTTFRSPSGDANGLLVQPDGALLACEHRNRRVTRTGTDGVVTTLAEKLGGKRLNGPNDVIARSDGNIYFTDPPYDVPLDQRDLDFQGVYRIDASGVLHLEHTGMTAPNGAALSLDEGTLYVGDSEDNFILQFAIHEDGSLAPPTPFVASVPNPDGMVTDDAGRLFVASIDGVRVFGTDGAPLGLLAVPTDIPSNVTFGDDDRRTLYITTRAKLFSVRLATPGHP